MARLSDSITYGNHAITGDVNVGGTLTGDGSGLTGTAPLRATSTTKADVGLGSVRDVDAYSKSEVDQINADIPVWEEITQAAYDAITPNSSTLYVVVG